MPATLYRQIVAPGLAFWLLAFQLDWKLRGIWWGIFLVTWSAALFLFWFGRWKLRQMEGLAEGANISEEPIRHGHGGLKAERAQGGFAV